MATHPAIPVTDNKGDEWLLGFSGRLVESSMGLIEGWWFVLEGPSFLNENGAHYDEVPVPLFTDWWPDEEAQAN